MMQSHLILVLAETGRLGSGGGPWLPGADLSLPRDGVPRESMAAGCRAGIIETIRQKARQWITP